MLQTIHIIAIIQGIFLLFVLFKNRAKYFFNDYFFLSATLFSLVIYLLGDYNSNLFISDYDIFVVDNTLFITFLFLFLKYLNTKDPFKIRSILPFFIPVLFYVSLELFEILIYESYQIEIIEHGLYFAFVTYLLAALYFAKIKINSNAIKIPFYIIILSLLFVYSASIFNFYTHSNNVALFNSIIIIEIALLFYYLTYFFVFNDSFIHLPVTTIKYKNSSLNEENIASYTIQMKNIMEAEKLFLDAALTLQTFSEKTAIPKHYISEILNVHLQKTFTQFVNEYRIQEFIHLYTNDENNHYSIIGIAYSVGFKNKSTFNTTFKKFTGVSPSEYPKK
jgi:AraC-like DNA-binding protein